MAVSNGEAYIGDAIDSILKQTLPSWELIVVDDGSTDSTAQILANITDNRVKVIRNEGNLGLAASLNIGLRLASGRFVARLDSDDIALPWRLAHQVSVMNANQEISVLGSAVVPFRYVEETHVIEAVSGLLAASRVRSVNKDLLRGNCLSHPGVMLRRSFLQESGVEYDERLRNAQDYDLWCRVALRALVCRDSAPVTLYRIHEQQQSVVNFRRQCRTALGVQASYIMESRRRRLISTRCYASSLLWLLWRYIHCR